MTQLKFRIRMNAIKAENTRFADDACLNTTNFMVQ